MAKLTCPPADIQFGAKELKKDFVNNTHSLCNSVNTIVLTVGVLQSRIKYLIFQAT